MGQCRVSVARRRGGPRYARVGPQPGRRGHTTQRGAGPTGQIPQGGGHTEGGSARGQTARGPGAEGSSRTNHGVRPGDDWRQENAHARPNRRPRGTWSRAPLRRAQGPTAGPTPARNEPAMAARRPPKARLRTRRWSPGRRLPDGARRLTSLSDGVRRPARSDPEGRAGLRPEPCGSHIRGASGRLRPPPIAATLGRPSPQPATAVGGGRRTEPDPPCARPPCRRVARKLHPERKSAAPQAGRSAWIKAPE